ncbi:hypothetical protein PYCC9005_004929 [Savitreella phatthalungensis]
MPSSVDVICLFGLASARFVTYEGVTFNPGVTVCTLPSAEISWSGFDILNEDIDWRFTAAASIEFPASEGSRVALRELDHHAEGLLRFGVPYERHGPRKLQFFYDDAAYQPVDADDPRWLACRGYDH